MAIKTTDEYVIPISIKDEVTAKLKEIEKATKSFFNTIESGTSQRMGGGLAKTAESMKQVSKNAKDANSSVSIFGATFGRLGSAVFIANSYLDFFNRTIRTFSVAVGGAVKPAIELEAGLSKISTVVPNAGDSMNQFKQDILGFQKLYGSEQADLISGYYELLQSGAVESADATTVMATAQKMAVAGFSTTDKMITGLISVLATYNMKATDTIRIADLMAIANRNGRVSIEGLAENIGQVAGLAKAMNISLEETFSAMSTISMATNNSAEAMTAFRAIITGMSKQTGDFTGVLSRLGYTSIQAMVAQKGFLGTLKALTGEAGMSVEALSDIFGRVESQVALNMLLSERTQQNYITNMNQMQDGLKNIGAETDAMLYKAMDNTDRKMKILKGSLYALFAGLGESLLEPIKDSVDTLISTVYDFETKIRALSNAYKDLINDQEKVNQLLIIFAEIIGSISLGLLIANIGTLIAMAGKLITAFAGFVAFNFITGAIIVGVMALALAIEVVYRNWDIAVTAFEVGLKKLESYWLSMKITALDSFNGIISGMNKVGMVSDEMANSLRLNTNKDEEAQANLNSEINKSSANFTNLIKNFKGPAIYEYFSKSSNAVETFNKHLSKAEFNSKLVGQALSEADLTKFKTVVPEQKNVSLDYSRADIGKFATVDDTVLGQYQGAYNKAKFDHKEYLDAIAKANKDFRAKGNKDEGGSIAASILSAEEKYRESLRGFEEFWFKEMKKSKEEVLDITIKADYELQPNTQSYKKMQKDYEKYLETTAAMEAKQGQLGFGVKQKKEDLDLKKKLYLLSQQTLKGGKYMGYEVKSVELAKQDLDIARQAYAVSLGAVDLAKKEIFNRKAGAIAYEQMIDSAEKLTKFEKEVADIKESGGIALFNAEQLQMVEKLFGTKKSPFEFTFKNVQENPNEAMDAGLQNIGSSLSESMSSFSTFMSGPMGIAESASTLIGGLSSAMSIYLSIPKLLNAFLESLLNFPTEFMNSLSGILDKIPQIFTNFVPMIIDAFSMLLDFPGKMIDAIFEGLSKMFEGDFMERLGRMAVKLLEFIFIRFWIYAIKIIAGIVKAAASFIKNIPKMLKDFVRGFVIGMKEAINDLAKTLGMGKIFKIPMPDTKKLKEMGEKFANSAQQMFSVTDIEPKKMGTNMMDKINAAIDSFGKKSFDIWKWITDKLWGLWTWVRDKILMPFYGALKEAWLWVYDTILYPIISGLKDAWMWIYNKIIEPLISGIKGVANFFAKIFTGFINSLVPVIKFIETIFAGVINAFKGIIDGIALVFSNIFNIIKTVIDGVIGAVSGIFGAVISAFEGVFKFAETIFNGIVNTFSAVFSIFTPIVDGIKSALMALGNFLSPIMSVFSSMTSSIGDAFSAINFSKFGEDIGNAFKKILDPLLDAFKGIGNGVIDMINGLKIPKLQFKVEYIGTIKLWDEIDLIPGDIQRFATGGMAMGTDTIPAMLTPGEFIVNRDATAKNIDLLRNINAGREPITAGGGTTNFNITINAKTYLDQDAIKREILPTIERELKRKSLDGSFIIAASGIRK